MTSRGGRRQRRLAGELAAAAVAEVIAVEAAALEPVHGRRLHGGAAPQIIAGQAPAYVLFPHTYQARDFVPKLAARLQRPLITDVVGITDAGGRRRSRAWSSRGSWRPTSMPEGDAPCLVTVQAGAFHADGVRRGAGAGARVAGCR